MIVVPNVGAVELLELLLPVWTPWVHLYTTDTPLELDTVIGDFVEANYPGYAAQLATGWTEPEIANRRANTMADPLIFARTNGDPQQECWGYYVTRGITGPLLWAERFADPPWPMRVSTDVITIQLAFSDRGERRRLSTGL